MHIRKTNRPTVIALLCSGVILTSALSWGATPPPSGTEPESLQIEMPQSLRTDRGEFERDVVSAIDEVTRRFREWGIDLPASRLIDSVRLYDGVSDARESLARTFAVPVDQVPTTFSGTVVGRTLYLVSSESYREIWGKTYPSWPWTDRTYQQLIVHELAHRAHEEAAIARFGSAEAMGPDWFFEGLAIVCAGQFEAGEPLSSMDSVKELAGSGRTPVVSYPLYGQMVRSLAIHFGIKTLFERAAEPNFPDNLWSAADRARSSDHR